MSHSQGMPTTERSRNPHSDPTRPEGDPARDADISHLGDHQELGARLLATGQADSVDDLLFVLRNVQPAVLAMLVADPDATLRTTMAVLIGWREADVPEAGRFALEPSQAADEAERRGVLPTPELLDAAVRHGAAANRLDLCHNHIMEWARSGLIDWRAQPVDPSFLIPYSAD